MLSVSVSDSQTTHAIIFIDLMTLLQKVKSGVRPPVCYASTSHVHLRRLLFVHCLGQAGVQRNDRADKTGRQSNSDKGLKPEKVLSVEELERNTTCGSKAEDITPSIACRRYM